MVISSPSSKILAVVHVGSVNGVVRNASQTPQQEPLSKYELHGAAVDVCRQIMTQTACVTEPYKVKVTKDAVDDGGGDEGFASLSLFPDSTCYTVGNGGTLLVFVCFS